MDESRLTSVLCLHSIFILSPFRLRQRAGCSLLSRLRSHRHRLAHTSFHHPAVQEKDLMSVCWDRIAHVNVILGPLSRSATTSKQQHMKAEPLPFDQYPLADLLRHDNSNTIRGMTAYTLLYTSIQERRVIAYTFLMLHSQVIPTRTRSEKPF